MEIKDFRLNCNRTDNKETIRNRKGGKMGGSEKQVICGLCPHRCSLAEGQAGFCRARSNRNGTITCDNYGQITSIALDPIEKKPLYHFYPGSRILSVGSYGCNLRCPFCQNYDISMAGKGQAGIEYISPEKLVMTAVRMAGTTVAPSAGNKKGSRNPADRQDQDQGQGQGQDQDQGQGQGQGQYCGNIGIAYTYNEPLISYEYILDCSSLARQAGLKNVLVTNGYICEDPLRKLLPCIDALNIDLKAFSDSFYKKISGDLETVKCSIMIAAESAAHVEVTTLIIPDENDSPGEMDKLSAWIASINPAIPLHLSRFFPHYKMTDRNATDVSSVYSLADIARRHLSHVYEGNC